MPCKRQKMLLVEDNDHDAFFVENAMKNIGADADITHVHDSDGAVPAIEEDRPDLILLDLNMPGMNGHDILKLLKNDDATRDIPVVVFSSSEDPKDIADCYAEFANAYVVKPHTLEGYDRFAMNVTNFWFETARLRN